MAGLKKISIKIWLLAVCLCIFCPEKVSAAQAGPAAGAKAGVVEVQSGFLDKKGKFRVMKSASGFLISNDTDDTYIITNCSNVSNTLQAIKKYCKKNSIDTADMQFSNQIQVVVKGDITADAEVVVKSTEKDYCVLSAANVVSQKESLKLGDSSRAAVQDPVFAYGFLKDAGMQEGAMDYSEADVKMLQGVLTENETNLDQNAYLVHTAPITQGYAGGPLLDADGYVIGVNCRQPSEDDTGAAYALPVNEICAVLDNFSIHYGSRKIDEVYAGLQALHQECAGLYEAGGYKRESAEALKKALTEAEEVLQQEKPGAAELEEAGRALLEAKDGLVLKMKKLTMLMIGLGVCDGILFLWLLILAIKNASEKKKMNRLLQNTAGQNRPLQNTASQNRQAPSEYKMIRLTRKKTGQSIPVNRRNFSMGKNPSATDYCIADNQTVSRKHAVLYEKNGSWYIDDMDSLNGTYVNGSRVLPGQAVLVKDGDEIALSDESFLVQI